MTYNSLDGHKILVNLEKVFTNFGAEISPKIKLFGRSSFGYRLPILICDRRTHYFLSRHHSILGCTNLLEEDTSNNFGVEIQGSLHDAESVYIFLFLIKFLFIYV